ncbi:MAG: hypothetical protein IIC22_05855 [Chloroflexi bacterium]|nr:hypothetical protein [Chloroflexota bacterium]
MGWEASPGATTYRVFRSTYVEIPLSLFDGYIGKNGCFKDYEPPPEELPEGLVDYLNQMPEPLIGIGLKPLPFKKGEVPGESVEIGTTGDTFFFDATAEKGVKYAYHVIAEDETGVMFPSETSNLSTVPLLVPTITFNSLNNVLASLRSQGKFNDPNVGRFVHLILKYAESQARRGRLGFAELVIKGLHRKVAESGQQMLEPFAARDLELQLSRFAKKIELSRKGALTTQELIR